MQLRGNTLETLIYHLITKAFVLYQGNLGQRDRRIAVKPVFERIGTLGWHDRMESSTR